jgi:hypothetical protein
MAQFGKDWSNTIPSMMNSSILLDVFGTTVECQNGMNRTLVLRSIRAILYMSLFVITIKWPQKTVRNSFALVAVLITPNGNSIILHRRA